ncbi:hypothetical protein ACN6J9_06500 [Carnobacterium maltaromaticum]|uniref:hypothetical protein n=1 Tax=Carnobacterium maltaromaticum TaxID=2751 RepID=UPI003AFA886D
MLDNERNDSSRIYPLEEELLVPVYKELYSLVGESGTIAIFNAFKGRQIQFPMRFYKKEAIVQQIKNSDRQVTNKELAKRYDVTERFIRSVRSQ